MCSPRMLSGSCQKRENGSDGHGRIVVDYCTLLRVRLLYILQIIVKTIITTVEVGQRWVLNGGV